jgi:hypothetical protein
MRRRSEYLGRYTKYASLVTILCLCPTVIASCSADSEEKAVDQRAEFEVTLTSSGCTFEGPQEVSPGDHFFLLIDETGSRPELAVRRIADGHTFQDLVDAQPVPGEFFDRPDFIEDELLSLAAKPDIELADNEQLVGWILRLGLHDIHTWERGKGSDGVRSLWFCGGFEVSDADQSG